ncbi:uncharacterized protein EV420DRAFT_1667673 [Desarmillaria tabescens]|uniref:C2H2-type domain-containing protein n=1 Tax=Armillaria tabescens TaxID=1929756 RepID=A0AA39TVK5_ARMTA|nr:uncharacterized protein EV420DRAFT_1667673 [Desarmillaria tabescens]KAK0460935.1 hypothetical protein EV420DRAFT_1667673 [Desarmillaria tabescens]
MSFVLAEYDSDFSYLHLSRRRAVRPCPPLLSSGCLMIVFRGLQDSLPLLLFSDQTDGFFDVEKTLYDEICDGAAYPDAPASESPFDPEAYSSYGAWSPVNSPRESFNSDATSPATTIDPTTTLSGSTLAFSLPASPCVQPNIAEDEHAGHTTKQLRTHYTRGAKKMANYSEETDEEDEYEPKPNTRSPKRARRTPLSTPELDSDVSSLPSTPLSTSVRSPRQTLPLPRRASRVRKPKGNYSSPEKDYDVSDDDSDFCLNDKPKKSQRHRPRGTGDFPCTFENCGMMFQRANDRKRHQHFCREHMDPDQRRALDAKTQCDACGKSVSRSDALMRHKRTCRELHPELN